MSIPHIPAEDLTWSPDESGSHRATIQIGSQLMHLMALPVRDTDDGTLETTAPLWQDDLDHLCDLLGARPQTTTINGRDCVIYALPYGD